MAKMNILPNFGDKRPMEALANAILNGEIDTIGGMPISPTWTTKSGTKIPVTEMEDSHLSNSIEMVKCRLVQHQQQIAQIQGSLDKLYAEKIRRLNAKKAQAKAEKYAASKKRAEKKLVSTIQTTGRRFRES